MSNVRSFVGMLFFLAIAGCSEDDFEPIVQKQSRLLGGGGGNGEKRWTLVSGTAAGSGFSEPLELPDCFADNIYTFKNNASQQYHIGEGDTKCDSQDSNTTEKGSWAITLDGKSIILHASEFTQSQSTFIFVRATIDELTDTSFKISFTNENSSDLITYTLVFKAVP